MPRVLAPGRACTLAAAIAAAIATYVAMTEGTASNVLFTIGVIGVAAGLITLLSRRILLSTFIAAAMVALLSFIASLKQATGVTLHAYDAVSLLTSWVALRGLWHSQGPHPLHQRKTRQGLRQ